MKVWQRKFAVVYCNACAVHIMRAAGCAKVVMAMYMLKYQCIDVHKVSILYAFLETTIATNELCGVRLLCFLEMYALKT